jgi:hypothetical protein
VTTLREVLHNEHGAVFPIVLSHSSPTQLYTTYCVLSTIHTIAAVH